MRTPTEKRQALRTMLTTGEIVVAPGCADALQAQLVESVGLQAVHASGSVAHVTAGYPDENLLTMTELLDRFAAMADAVEIPVIADGETGFGSAANVVRTVREYERAGVAALHLEDSLLPKQSHADPHLAGVVSRQEMVDKIRAAVDARTDASLVIIARSELKGDPQEVQERLAACLEAGADMAWLAARSPDEIRAARRAFAAPLIGVLPQGMTIVEYRELGANCALIPSALQIASLYGQRQLLVELLQGGTVASYYAQRSDIHDLQDFYNRRIH